MRDSKWEVFGLVVFVVVLGSSSYVFANGNGPICTGNQNCNTEDNSTNATGGNAVATGGDVSSTLDNTNVVETTSGATANSGDNRTSQSVDSGDVQVYGHDSAPAAEGTSAISIGTVVGGISFAHTEAYVKIRGHIAELVTLKNAGLVGDDGVLTETEWADDYRKSIRRLSRVSGRGERTLMNLFGIIR